MKPTELARQTVEKYIKENTLLNPPSNLSGVDTDKAGVFVSIKTLNKDLRGCIGTIFPTKNSIMEEIIHNSIAAATSDPRFSAVNRTELSNLEYSVDILHLPEPIKSISELDPKTYGIIIVSESGRQALLLPNLDGVDTVDDQISICRKKAGLPPAEKITIHKFKVERFTEE